MKAKCKPRNAKSRDARHRCASNRPPRRRMTGDEPDSQQLAQQAALNASPDELKKVIDFSHEVFTTAENHDLSNDQLMASLMAVITMLVKEREAAAPGSDVSKGSRGRAGGDAAASELHRKLQL